MPHRPYALQIAQNQGCKLFAGLPCRFDTLMQKFAMPCGRTRPPLFCAISPEADPLGKNSSPIYWAGRAFNELTGKSEERAGNIRHLLKLIN